MAESMDDNTEGFEAPRPSDGFHQPSEETKRRNYITAAIIFGIIFLWILLGLYRVMF